MKDYFEEMGKYIDVNGVKTHFYDAGSGTPLVLIHGGGHCVAAAIQWRYNIEELSKNFRVIAPDELGFGMTGMPANPEYSLKERAEHVAALLRKLNVKAAIVCGQSQGAYIASYLGLEYPEMVSKLIICNTGSITMVKGRVSTAFDFDAPFDREATRLFYSRIVHNPSLITDEVVDLAFEYGKRNFETRRKDQELHLLNDEGRIQNTLYKGKHMSEQVHGLKVPMLIVWGVNDVVPLERGLWLFDQVEKSELHVFKGASHLVFMDRYKEFNALVKSFATQ